MPSMPYFRGHSWIELTREERFYCAALYEHARANPRDFALWVAQSAGLNIVEESEWDLGVEVCFYRDYLWHKGNSARAMGFSPKRTFDLCLFGPRTIIIIEAKVFQGFDAKQNRVFAEDAQRIRDLPEMNDVTVTLVALASSKYYRTLDERGDKRALELFDGRISWDAAFEKYRDNLLLQADGLYGSKVRRLSS